MSKFANDIIIILFTLIHLFPIFVAGVYILESYRSSKEVSYNEYETCIKYLFNISSIGLMILWLLTPAPENKRIVVVFILSALLWFLLAVGAFIVSLQKKWSIEVRVKYRSIMISNVIKTVILTIMIWLIKF